MREKELNISNFVKIDGKPNIIVNDDTLVEALAQCVEKLKTIYPMVKNDPSYDPEKFKQYVVYLLYVLGGF